MKSREFAGSTLFHLHTTYTDGVATVGDYFDFAVKERVSRLVFLEHIRTVPTYVVEDFISEVRGCSKKCAVDAAVGFETKLLPDGSLDILDEHIALAEVIGMAEHAFPADVHLYFTALRKAIDRYSVLNMPVVWVHPGLFLKRTRILEQYHKQYLDLIGYGISKGLIIERNLRYNLVAKRDVSVIPKDALVYGYDAHSLEDLRVLGEADRAVFDINTVLST